MSPLDCSSALVGILQIAYFILLVARRPASHAHDNAGPFSDHVTGGKMRMNLYSCAESELLRVSYVI